VSEIRGGRFWARRTQLQRSMRPPRVVVRGIRGEHPAQVSLTEDQHPVGDFRIGRSTRNARRSSSPRASRRDLDHLDAGVCPHRVERRTVPPDPEFLEVLNLIGRAPDSSVVGRIDGSVSPNARQQTVDNFTGRPGHAVLLAQIEAGGVGINMQAASVVVLTEPQWKPSTEEQAIARAHRMGQVRPVHVHRLLAKDSIDERIQEISPAGSPLP
jgi:hypothetical protein